ncbi:MAG: hypothetical protein AAFY76_01725 [Cyanobacteria bacterium J06649_11]
MIEVLGGSHKEIKDTYPEIGPGHGYHSHHVYSWAAYSHILGITYGEGPAVRMVSQDHRKTASCGNNVVGYREKQSSLLACGKYRSAWMMDVSDIRAKFGDKYDQHLVQAERHLLKLDHERKLELKPKFKKELAERQKINQKLETAIKAQNALQEANARKELKATYQQSQKQSQVRRQRQRR